MPVTCRVLVADDGEGLVSLAKGLFTGPVEEAGVVRLKDITDAVVRLKANVVLVVLGLRSQQAVSAIEKLMAERPTPVLLVAREGSDRKSAFAALAAGALEIFEVPKEPRPDVWRRLHEQLDHLARLSVLPQVRGRRQQVATHVALRPVYPVVAIAASLGGPKALAAVLKGLPTTFTAPVLICQHITSGFSDDLARWLAAESKREVLEVTRAQALREGAVYVAPSGLHLAVRPGGRVELDDGEPVGGFKPSCDVLLRTAASAFGDRAIGVVLTGMGRDGARGLKEIRARGGHTVAQDEATSTVFGMPQEAIALGAAEKILPLDKIAAQLDAWTRS